MATPEEPKTATDTPTATEPATDNGTLAAKGAKGSRPKALKVLPTERIAVPKQLDIVRAYGQLGLNGNVVTTADVSRVVGLNPSTTSLAHPFLNDVGLIQSTTEGQIPSAEAIAFARAYEWNKEQAPHKLGPLMVNCWFGATLIPKVRFRAHTRNEALTILADASGAAKEHTRQLENLLELMKLTGALQIEGDHVRAGKVNEEQPQESQQSSKSEPNDNVISGPAMSIPGDFVIYKCKISGGRIIEIPLPRKFTASDAERIFAFLKTQVDDDGPLQFRHEP